MGTPARLGLLAAALAVVSGASYALGAATDGDGDRDDPAEAKVTEATNAIARLVKS